MTYLNNSDAYLSCTLCPHNCKANRVTGKLGVCLTDTSFNIASICAHKGEEPVISGENGICNVFFYHCNMQCVYCQNFQISKNCTSLNSQYTDKKAIGEICQLLDSGCHALGFVSPSHCIVQMSEIIEKVNIKGFYPVVVYNSNAYDKVETLKMLEKCVDLYLPDFKYADDNLAYQLSGVKNYTLTALKAIEEMIRQKNEILELNDMGLASKGVIIRHLVLPNFIGNSKKVLQTIADKFGNNIHISLMSQYFPTPQVMKNNELNSFIDADAYNEIVDFLCDLGFENGFIQEIDSINNYRPDFDKTHPFENH